MLVKLIEKAEKKAGSQIALGKLFKIQRVRLADYKAGRRIPDDTLIGELAEYVGLNPIETILQCKLETDKEKATLWQAWLSKIVVRSAGLEPTPQASETYYPGEVEMIKFILFLITYIIKILPGQITRTNHLGKSPGQITRTNHLGKLAGQITRANHPITFKALQ